MKNFIVAYLVLALVGCTSGGGAVDQGSGMGTFSLIPGVTALDSSTPAIHRASYYEVVSSSSDKNTVTLSGQGLGTYTTPSGQNFVVESKKRLEFSNVMQTNGTVNLTGRFSLPSGASIDIELIWTATTKLRVRYAKNGGQIEQTVVRTHAGVSTSPQNIGTVNENDVVTLQIAKEPGNTVTVYNTTTLLFDSATDASMVSADPYIRITVNNPSVSSTIFSIDSVATTFQSVARP